MKFQFPIRWLRYDDVEFNAGKHGEANLITMGPERNQFPVY